MRKIPTVLFLLLSLLCKSQTDNRNNFETIDDFITAFYQSHDDPNNMIKFFEPEYFKTYYKFAEHMNLKNTQMGHFVELKLLKEKGLSDKNFLQRTYEITYSKGILVEDLKLVRNDKKCLITLWKTKRK